MNTVAKYMRELNLNGDRRKKRHKIITTDSNHLQPIADRLFKTKESDLPQSPGKIYVGDITYLPFKAAQKPCFLYMATVMDLFNREIVGCSLSKTMDAHLVCEALGQAKHLVIHGETIFHSDQGSQYASQEFREYLMKLGITQSMSRKGNCYDNAYIERFFSSFKREWLHRHALLTEEKLREVVFEYVFCWYNRKRLHSELGYLSPYEYRRKRGYA